ncbi:MAG TPA: hypothetical protein VJV03_13465 [Pyrinomonadaceae bacterium]|nr:hypothetical protein [Pyrinomonadaceae bacterium]
MKKSTEKAVSPCVIVGILVLVLACNWSDRPQNESRPNSNSSPVNSNAKASPVDSGITAENPVEQLIALCKSDNYTEAARHMRYPGTDESKREETANYESGDPEERRQVEMSCRRFRIMSGLNYTVSPERREQGFYVYDVEVTVEGKTEKELWAFRKSGDDYVLVDID